MNQALHIGPWLLEPELGQLSRGQTHHHLPPRLVRLLCLMASQPQRVWRRETLIEGVWGQRPVNEEALSRAISQLRQLVGDQPGNPRFIATVPKVGYRLLVPVRAAVSGGNGPGQNLPPDESPLDNRSSGPSSATSWAGTLKHGMLGPGLVKLGLGLILLAAAVIVSVLWWRPATPPTVARDLLFNARRMTASPGVERFVELSPDGRYMAYVAVHDQRYAVHLVAVDTDQRQILASNYSQISPAFAPDGEHLAVAELRDGRCVVVIMGLEQGVATDVRRDVGTCQPQGVIPILDWSPDGRYLAVSDRSPQTGSAAIWQIDVGPGDVGPGDDGPGNSGRRQGVRQQLTRPPDAYHHDARPRYTPDQQRLSFTRGTPAYRELFLLTLDLSHAAQQLTFDRHYIVGHDWLNDSDRLIFDSDRSGERGLWALSTTAAQPTPQPLGALGSQYPSVADRSGRLAFQVAQYEANIWRYDLNARQPPSALIRSTKYDSHPAYSADGQYIAFSSNRSGHGALWLSPVQGGAERKVHEPVSGRAAWPVWAPDGRSLLFVHYQQGGQWISQLDLESGRSRRLMLPHQGFGADYSADGEWVTYTALVPGVGTQIWRFAAAALGTHWPVAGTVDSAATVTDGSSIGGPSIDDSAASGNEALSSQPISPPGANRGLLGPQGELFFTRSGQSGIYVLAADAAQAQLLIPDHDAQDWANWQLHGNTIIYVRRGPDHSGVWQYHLETERATRLTDQVPTALGPALSLHPQKDVLLLALTDRAEADLFLVDPMIKGKPWPVN